MSMLVAPAPAVSGPAPGQDYGFPPFFPTTTTTAAASLMAPGYFNPAYLGDCSGLYGGSGMLPMEDNSWMAALPSPDLTPTFTPEGFTLMDSSQDVNTYTTPFDARFNTSGSFGDAASLPQMPPTTTIQNAPSQSNDDLPQPQTIKVQSSSPRSSSSPSPPPRRTRRSRSPPTPVLPEDHRARAAHNVVEKHYRRRLNAQFAALLHALPAQLHPDGGSDEAAAGKKVRKAEVLELARQYIEALEKSGKALRREREMLAGRLEWMQERTGMM